MIRTMAYSQTNLVVDLSWEHLIQLHRMGSIVWVDLDQPTEEEWDLVGEYFSLHPLAIVNSKHYTDQSQIREYENGLFIVTHTITHNRVTDKLVKKELDVFLGNDFLITVHRSPMHFLDRVYSGVQSNPQIAAHGAGSILYSVFQESIDDIVPVVNYFDERAERVEENILLGETDGILQQIVYLRRSVNDLKRDLAPLIDQYKQLSHWESRFVTRRASVYFGLLSDRMLRLFENTEIIRDAIMGSHDTYLSVVSNRMNEISFKMNEIMHRLTVVSTIFLPLTFITGWYGMNFRFMPELSWRFGYLAIILLMIGITGGLSWYFKKKGWLK